MDRVEKLLDSRRDAAEAHSLSIRSVDYRITTGRLTMLKVGDKILISAGTVRKFTREDHPKYVHTKAVSASVHGKKPPAITPALFCKGKVQGNILYR